MGTVTVSKSFTAAGNGDQLQVRHGESLTYSLSGTFSGTAVVEKSVNGGQSWEAQTAVLSAADSGTLFCETTTRENALYRWRCVSRASGTLVTSLADVARVLFEKTDDNGAVVFQITEDGVSSSVRPSQKRLVQNAAKVGGTAGWVVNAADDKNSLARLPASQTASTLVVPLSFLKVGDTLTGFHLVGQIESAGNAVTIDADLRKQTAAAADLSDASVGAITQLSVTGDTIISASNSRKASLSDVVGADETFYVLITATTGASTDIDLQAVAVEFTEA